MFLRCSSSGGMSLVRGVSRRGMLQKQQQQRLLRRLIVAASSSSASACEAAASARKIETNTTTKTEGTRDAVVKTPSRHSMAHHQHQHVLQQHHQQYPHPHSYQHQQKRQMVSKPPGLDPLEVLKRECLARKLCNEKGNRLPGVHWVISIAVSPPQPDGDTSASDLQQAPNLRTIGIERISSLGIDFVMKKDSKISSSIARGIPVSVMHTQGKYIPGEVVEQWRSEGHCEILPLPEILPYIPHYTITSMIGSKRIVNEREEQKQAQQGDAASKTSLGRLPLMNKSHVTELMQKTRVELENGDISLDEMEDCILALRFVPHRMECMIGGPDTTSIVWDRWEWIRDDAGDCPLGTIPWNQPNHLIPH